jgi:hypothetical protein
MDDLSKQLSNIAPPVPGLAEATTIAPERRASPLPSPTSELSSPTLTTPGIVVSDNPQSPPTLIPATDSLSTRPTKGGIAYPFSLRIDGSEGKDVNASTLTLQSMNITTPPAVDVSQQDKNFGYVDPARETVSNAMSNERPGVERYYTAALGAGMFGADAAADTTGGAEKDERPPVERFETAREDLSTLADAKPKA